MGKDMSQSTSNLNLRALLGKRLYSVYVYTLLRQNARKPNKNKIAERDREIERERERERKREREDEEDSKHEWRKPAFSTYITTSTL
jgi:hypothetical protein